MKVLKQRLEENIFGSLSGPLEALNYLRRARTSPAEYAHWGLQRIYGREETQRVLASAHSDAFSTVLKTPISKLAQELGAHDQPERLSEMLEAEDIERLIPVDRGAGLDSHFRLVLYVLSCLAPGTAASNPEDACRSQSPVR